MTISSRSTGPMPGTTFSYLIRLPRRLVDLVELDLRAALGRREQLDRDRDERQPDLSSPDRTRSHDSTLLRGRDSIHCGHRVVPCRAFNDAYQAAVTSPPRAARSTIAEPQMTPLAPAASAARTCSGFEIPKPKTGGGAPARRAGRSSVAIELAAGVGAGDPGAADAIGVGFRQPGDARAAWRRACSRRRSAPARCPPAPSRGRRAPPRARARRRSAGCRRPPRPRRA